SDEYYAAGEYAAAFAELESAARLVDDSEAVENAIVALERRFVDDRIAAARELVGGDRGNIDSAKAIIADAYAVRPLPEFTAFSEKLENWKPVNLATTVDFALERIGDVFRNADAFVTCGDVGYYGGWIWGENGAMITFNIGGGYDRFRGSFAVQREADKAADAYFEVWCDGSLKYTSDMLINGAYSQDFDYDISGCSQLTLKFVCAYDASTVSGGFCYHGITDPQIMRNME
ncbi:MAG: NPCBM/NEW2 domain-containing protein, partial [Clostridia bacterium]|nr:NPCBM/NEW2 domain-containing protein [Clostridia bacterium]